MTLTPADIDAIATAVVRKLQAAEQIRMDADFLALDIEEMKRRSDEAFRAERRKRKK